MTLARILRLAGAGLAATAVGWGGYAAVTWWRYGKDADAGLPNPLLDGFLPHPEVRERHETRVRAPADRTWAAAEDLDLARSPVIRAIFSARELLMGSKAAGNRQPSGFLDQIRALGWRQLAEEPGRALVFGAVTQPWEANVVFRGLDPDEFARFDQPGYAAIAWTFEVHPVAPDESIFRTETRVRTTDPHSCERFRRYWSIMSPGIRLIRLESLRLIRTDAEHRAS
ncbi:MAG TPA: hypothetical protein VF046_05120 [Gemmatimonadales bacterium]